MDLAKQGDPHAIASLINRSLASKGIHAVAELESECLKISLKAAQIPNQKAVVTIIHRGMIVLQVKQIKQVKILTYRSDNNYLAWQHDIDLVNEDLVNETKQQSSASPQIAKDAKVEQAQNMNLVSNPKGVILVQKLSQIQQNLQEYQDVIIRFTDEQVGTVRCLTTLTELIQVISQPSFLFAAVASNPNLRSLLDTIAESSKTDQHGDQVITNLSILQPGQQWQKAKIRLVTKIFLEPDEPVQEDEPNAPHQGITLDLAESEPDLIPETEPDPISEQNPYIDLHIPSPEIPQDYPEDLMANLGSESNLDEAITVNSLFDDFPESSSLTSEDSQVTSKSRLDDNLGSDNLEDGNLETITVNSLFDDFPESSSLSSQPVQIVNDITENLDFADSLFDDFMNVDSANSYPESDDSSVYQVDEAAKTTIVEDDLFDDFLPSDRSSDQSLTSDITELEGDIETIRSRIPKQNLDELLQLMDEEDYIKSKPQAINKNDSEMQEKTDLGATTIERILGNMETISLNGSDSTASSDFVTLEDLSKDLNSVGF